MLILYRELGESIIIDGSTKIKVIELDPKFVKLGFLAPSGISIIREEIFNRKYKEKKS